VRPRSIIYFERLFLASLGIAPVQIYLAWDELAAREHLRDRLFLVLLVVATLAGLVLLVSRGRIAWAKWLLAILWLIGLPLFLLDLNRGSILGWTLLAAVQALLQSGSLALLFTDEARAWMKAGEE
jgi:hypothetical protein